MKKIKLLPRSVIFYKLYLCNILITVVFICLIAVVCSTFSSRLILDNLIDFNEGMIETKSKALDERINQLDNTINLMLEDENVFRFVMSGEDYYERPTALLKIIRHFQNVCSNSDLVEGVCLVDQERGIALTEKTKLDVSDEYLQKISKGQNAFVVQETDEGKKLELIKHFEPVSNERDVYVILTINENIFVDNLLDGNLPRVVQFYLLTEQEEIITSKGIGEIVPEIKKELIQQTDSTQEMEFQDEKLVLYKQKSQISDISFVAVQNYTYLLNEADAVKRVIIVASIVMILIATVIIYLSSRYLYRPLKQLGYKLSRMAATKQEEDMNNEYKLIENVLNELQSEREYAIPSVVRDSMEKLLTGPFDEERFDHLKSLLGQDMKYGRFILVVVECEAVEYRGEVLRSFDNLIRNCREIEGFFAGMTAIQYAGIFNTCLDYDLMIQKIEKLKEGLEQKEILITCCVSREFRNRENMSLVYSEALSTLEKKFFKGNHKLIYEAPSSEPEKAEPYSREMEKRLIKYVVEGKREKAFETIQTLTENLSNRAADIQYTRFVYLQLCSNLVRNVQELGGHLPKNYTERYIFNAIFSQKSILLLKQLAEEIVDTCTKCFERKEKTLSSNVEKAIAFIQINYMNDLSLEDVANAVFLSSGYLSIIFKEETGYTVLEYITCVRMNKAKELVLKTPALRVKDIAEQLGYNNVQSFIRYFKKYYGVTPMAYRKEER